jgi:alpha-L-arabinofuranosidase
MNRKSSIKTIMAICAGAGLVLAAEYHVATTGLDANPGTAAQPFKTIQKAATTMQPGDMCTVHEGTYRETVAPPRGGTSESSRITYRAAAGENVVIKGSEQITTWVQQSGNTWKADVATSAFGSFNPYQLTISGDWLTYGAGLFHLGNVYFNGEAYWEKSSLASVNSTAKTWYSSISGSTVSIYANFDGANPNTGLAEINQRECAIWPSASGLKYITIDGFTVSHGSSNWAPPNNSQKGMIGTYSGAYWIIQNCRVTDAKCVGICIRSNNPGYANMGHHIIRKNIIQRCGEAGVAGIYGGTATLIEGNLIEDINYKREFGGYETAGIKVHFSCDLTIKNNVIRRVRASNNGSALHDGIWIDYENQGTRITGNVIYECDQVCIHFEMDHGPQLVDNNVIIGSTSGSGVREAAESSVFVHNLFVNARWDWVGGDSRVALWYTPHTMNTAGQSAHSAAHERIYNNIHIQKGTDGSDGVPNWSDYKLDYDVYYQNAQKSTWGDAHSIVNNFFNAGFQITSLANGAEFSFNANTAPSDIQCPLITRSFIGLTPPTNQGIENPDGTPITIDKDFLGASRDAATPTAGPFENLQNGANTYTLIVGPEYDPGRVDSTGMNVSGFVATPQHVVNTQAVTVSFSITATDGDGTIASVVLDLSQLGGPASQAMTAGANGTYSASYTVAQDFSAGQKSVVATVRDNAGNEKTRSITVSVSGSTSYTAIYSDAETKVTYTWAGDGQTTATTAISEITGNASEGSKSYDLAFTIGGYWAGGGIGFNQMDFSAQDSIILSYKGPGSGLSVMVGLAFSDNTDTGQNGYQAANTGSFTRVAIPMSFFTGSFPMNSVKGINFIVSGAQTGTGHIYIDDIKLAGSGGSTANPNRTARFTKTDLKLTCNGRMLTLANAFQGAKVFDMKGTLVTRMNPAQSGISRKLLPSAGAYTIKVTSGNGMDVSRIIAR